MTRAALAFRSAVVVCVAALLAGGAVASLADAPAVDVTGTWYVNSSFHNQFTMDASGQVTGTLVENGATIDGSVSGHTLTYTDHYQGGGYSSHIVATISGDGQHYDGSFTDTNGSTGAIHAVRQSGPPSGGSGTSGMSGMSGMSGTSGATGTAAAGIQVNCDRDVATQAFTCTAQVADASGSTPATVPTGSVTFAIKPDGDGQFPDGATCQLQASQTGGASAFCSVRYLEGAHIPTGEQPSITATYGGDPTFGPATGEPMNEYAAPPPDDTPPSPPPDDTTSTASSTPSTSTPSTSTPTSSTPTTSTPSTSTPTSSTPTASTPTTLTPPTPPPSDEGDGGAGDGCQRAAVLRDLVVPSLRKQKCPSAIAKVRQSDGDVYKVDPHGGLTKLSPGDTLNIGDRILTTDGGKAIFDFTLGGSVHVQSNDDVAITAEGEVSPGRGRTPGQVVTDIENAWDIWKNGPYLNHGKPLELQKSGGLGIKG